MSSPGEIRYSIAICTLNRGTVLAETLAAVSPLLSSPASELIVVDNGSTDETEQILGEFTRSTTGNVRALREPRAGLSAARNRAVREARGDLLFFLDDDAVPAAGWLDAYAQAFRDPRVAAAGGPVEPIFDGPLPAWLDTRFLPYLSAWERGEAAIDLKYNELPRGANMVFRRSRFAAYGEFMEQLGRRGASLRSCEEIEFCLRLERGGERIVYVPGASVRHRVATGRLDLAWMRRRFAAQGFSEAVIDWRHAGWRGLRAGWRRARTHAPGTGSNAADARQADPFFSCLAEAFLGYRRGAIYAFLLVARFACPGGGALAPFRLLPEDRQRATPFAHRFPQ